MRLTVNQMLIYGVLPVVIFISVVITTGVVYAQTYAEKIFPGISIGPIDVGGLSHEEAAVKLSAATSAAIASGLVLTSQNGEVATIALTQEGIDNPDASFDLVSWNIDSAVSAAMQIGRSANLAVAIWQPIGIRLAPTSVPFSPTIDDARLQDEISDAFPALNVPAIDAGFVIEPSADGWTIVITPSQSGSVIQMNSVFEPMAEHLAAELFLPPLALEVVVDEPAIGDALANGQIDEVQTILAAAPYTLQSGDGPAAKSFAITAEELAPLLRPTVEGVLVNEAAVELVKDKASSVLVEPQDARLLMENGRVVEFVGSREGVQLNVGATLAELNGALGNHDQIIPISTVVVEPQVTTAEVNNLGIGEVLGVGTSNFSGSPTNRIKNIQNGARLLNGILIAPDEEFSLLAALRPFTTDNGYLPELVIKGDKIEPEVGGGLCQIGTTTFRATMHSGLPVTERRNHSLVVRYYNDPGNGNPGTDATIYDPAPDFKFMNDTGHWILFETAVDLTTKTLTFTFWGTSDGRQGLYSPPVVSAWIPVGEKKIIETTDLEPGVEKCQHAFPGANASFTYTVERPDGSKEEQIFTSSYRPLPEICLLGVEEEVDKVDIVDKADVIDDELTDLVPE